MIDLTDYGYAEAGSALEEAGLPARVTAVHKERYALVCKHGPAYGRLKAGVYYNGGAETFPTAGDFVCIIYNDCGDSRIIKTLERKSFFSRQDPTPGRGEQAVAANFDTVFIMASLNQDFNARRLERYLALSWQSGAVPVVVLTKSDLVVDYWGQMRAVEEIAPGVAAYAVSARTGAGLGELSAYLKPRRTVVFLGSSGVGKSSLLNALAGEEIMAAKEIREDDAKGRHTTTHRQLIMLPGGAMIIDTPGMRELGLWDASAGLGEAFADIEALTDRCRFGNCGHGSEPGCAVHDALLNGLLSEERWNSYLKLKKEVRFAEDKAAAMRERREWGKSIAKINRQNKKWRD